MLLSASILPQIKIHAFFFRNLYKVELKQWRETATLEAKPIPGRPSRKLGPLQVDLNQMLAADPDATLEQHCQTWEHLHGIKVSISTMSRAIKRLGWTRKKRRWELPSGTKPHAAPGESR